MDAMVAEAKGVIEQELGVPITQATKAWTDRAQTQRTDYSPTSLLLPRPIATAGLTVVDADARTLDPVEYDTTELVETGMLYAGRGYSFSNGPYSGSASVGLSAHPDYASRLEPIVNGIILDLVAEWYQHRSPGASQESDPGVSTSYFDGALPPRVRRMLRSLSSTIA